MIKTFFFTLGFYCISIILIAQPIDSSFYWKIYETSAHDNVIVFHRDSLQKINKYELSLQKWLTLSDTSRIAEKYYQLAVNYAKLDELDSAFFYLHNYIKVSKDDRLIFVDKAFEKLKSKPKRWEALTHKIEDLYLAQIASILEKDLALQLFHLNISMQKYEHFYQLLECEDSVPYYHIAQNHITNCETFKNMINKYGFPTQIKAGNLGERTAYALLNQQKITKDYYCDIKKRFHNSDFDTLAYALITDKYLSGKGKKQLFGSQLYYTSKKEHNKKVWIPALYPVRDFKNVNKRRRWAGFANTIEEYAKQNKAYISKKHNSFVNHEYSQISNKIYEKNPNKIILCKKDSLQKEEKYRASIQLYLKNADTLNVPLVRYRMAVNYAKLGIIDSAFLYLNYYIDISKDDRVIIVDKDFDSLRLDIDKWEKITKRIEDGYLQGLDSTKNKELALTLFYMGIEDQKYRVYLPRLNQVPWDSNGRFRILASHKEINSLEKMIKEYGYPTISKVGYLASLNAFLVLQHSDKIKKYYHKIKKIYKNGEIDPQDFAMLTDLCLKDKGRKQLYGTQLLKDSKLTEKKYPGKYILWPVKNFKNVNERRKIMGFSETVEEYVANWNDENYIIPKTYYKRIRKSEK